MRDIKFYEELYAVTRDGQVWSKKRKMFLKIQTLKSGYSVVTLSKNGQRKNHYVHRLVGEAYLPNPSDLPQINHKNEDKNDNRLENLEWCNAIYNMNYGTRAIRAAGTRKAKNK